jgi:hypothetical protein
VASPTEEFHTAKEETVKTIASSGERPTQRKSRLNSGEDAGIGGSDHGEIPSIIYGSGSELSLSLTN